MEYTLGGVFKSHLHSLIITINNLGKSRLYSLRLFYSDCSVDNFDNMKFNHSFNTWSKNRSNISSLFRNSTFVLHNIIYNSIKLCKYLK